MKNRKIIASSTYWICENMDLLAPIIEEGAEYLLDDSTTIRVPYNTTEKAKYEKLLKDLEVATDEEKKQYAREHYGIIYEGDEVVIKRGRKMVGEHKIVAKSFRYYVDGTYNKQYVDYLIFTDGTKVNINHCDTINTTYKPYIYNGKEYFFREYCINLYQTPFAVGGRK